MSSSSNELAPLSVVQQKLQQWLAYDSQVHRQQQLLKELREKRDLIEKQLTTVLDKKQLSNIMLNCGDARIKYGMCKETQPLSFRLLEQCLREIISNDEQVEQIISYVKEKREVKMVGSLKRV